MQTSIVPNEFALVAVIYLYHVVVFNAVAIFGYVDFKLYLKEVRYIN